MFEVVLFFSFGKQPFSKVHRNDDDDDISHDDFVEDVDNFSCYKKYRTAPHSEWHPIMVFANSVGKPG